MAKREKTGGRVKGTPNKRTALLKDAILEAAELAGNETGDKQGLVSYLKQQAKINPTAFLTLLGKVLPMQVAGPDDEEGNPTTIEMHIVRPKG